MKQTQLTGWIANNEAKEPGELRLASSVKAEIKSAKVKRYAKGTVRGDLPKIIVKVHDGSHFAFVARTGDNKTKNGQVLTHRHVCISNKLYF